MEASGRSARTEGGGDGGGSLPEWEAEVSWERIARGVLSIMRSLFLSRTLGTEHLGHRWRRFGSRGCGQPWKEGGPGARTPVRGPEQTNDTQARVAFAAGDSRLGERTWDGGLCVGVDGMCERRRTGGGLKVAFGLPMLRSCMFGNGQGGGWERSEPS